MRIISPSFTNKRIEKQSYYIKSNCKTIVWDLIIVWGYNLYSELMRIKSSRNVPWKFI